MSFIPIAESRNDSQYALRCRAQAADLKRNLDEHAWDGQWHLRAWFDDGFALGASVNEECSIDSFAQSWSALSAAGTRARARQAMQSMDRLLVRRDVAVIQLLDPPFDRSQQDPGYIRGYVPGVRENGGQYTHAAIWAAMAQAKLGDGARAWELLSPINPVNHTRDAEGVALYKTEPYVIAADVYGVAPQTGRGGWSCYTGSAGWFYRLILESLLGLRREGDQLYIAPCQPMPWPSFEMDYRFGQNLYSITVRSAQTATDSVGRRMQLDGVEHADESILLVDDGQTHQLEVTLAKALDTI